MIQNTVGVPNYFSFEEESAASRRQVTDHTVRRPGFRSVMSAGADAEEGFIGRPHKTEEFDKGQLDYVAILKQAAGVETFLGRSADSGDQNLKTKIHNLMPNAYMFDAAEPNLSEKVCKDALELAQLLVKVYEGIVAQDLPMDVRAKNEAKLYTYQNGLSFVEWQVRQRFPELVNSPEITITHDALETQMRPKSQRARRSMETPQRVRSFGPKDNEED